MSTSDYRKIVQHYERCFAAYGATAQGVDWPKQEDVDTRFAVMLGLLGADIDGASLLDLGCGYGALADYLARRGLLARCRYTGIDLSETMVAAARKRQPGLEFEARDILVDRLGAGCVDYVVMNGVLTEKVSLEYTAMEDFAESMIEAAFAACRKAIAFNVMSEHVDWKRDELFHWPFDRVAAFLKARCSRNFVFRADYGLYEYTTYVYREPNLKTV